MIRLVLVAGLSACWTGAAQPPAEPPPPPSPAPRLVHHLAPRTPCEITVDHLKDVEHDELSRVPDFADKLDELRDLAVASCEATHWTGELMDCLDHTADSTAVSQCGAFLTADQTQDLMQRIAEALMGLAAPPPIGP